MIVGDHLTTILRHTPLYVEKIMVAHPGRWWKARFVHRVASLNGVDATHVLVRDQHMFPIFLFKYSKVNVKIPKHLP
jgi:hypothetical protein